MDAQNTLLIHKSSSFSQNVRVEICGNLRNLRTVVYSSGLADFKSQI
jgi:hypothetical protein